MAEFLYKCPHKRDDCIDLCKSRLGPDNYKILLSYFIFNFNWQFFFFNVFFIAPRLSVDQNSLNFVSKNFCYDVMPNLIKTWQIKMLSYYSLIGNFFNEIFIATQLSVDTLCVTIWIVSSAPWIPYRLDLDLKSTFIV